MSDVWDVVLDLAARYECGDCGSKHQLKGMIDHKAGCVHE